jgi:hypothetical protein
MGQLAEDPAHLVRRVGHLVVEPPGASPAMCRRWETSRGRAALGARTREGGPTVADAAQILLRQAVASLLNSAGPDGPSYARRLGLHSGYRRAVYRG